MRNLAFHSLLRWKMIIPPILTTSLIQFSKKGWENVLFELGSERGKWCPSNMNLVVLLLLFCQISSQAWIPFLVRRCSHFKHWRQYQLPWWLTHSLQQVCWLSIIYINAAYTIILFLRVHDSGMSNLWTCQIGILNNEGLEEGQRHSCYLPWPEILGTRNLVFYLRFCADFLHYWNLGEIRATVRLSAFYIMTVVMYRMLLFHSWVKLTSHPDWGSITPQGFQGNWDNPNKIRMVGQSVIVINGDRVDVMIFKCPQFVLSVPVLGGHCVC